MNQFSPNGKKFNSTWSLATKRLPYLLKSKFVHTLIVYQLAIHLIDVNMLFVP